LKFALAVLLLAGNALATQPLQEGSSQAPALANATGTPNGKTEKPGKIYRVGGDVKPPRTISSPQPALDKEEIERARAGKKVVEAGSTVLSIVVGEDGSVRDVKVFKSLKRELDAKAIEAVKRWKFDPATKKGVPVAVQLAVQVDFHLYK